MSRLVRAVAGSLVAFCVGGCLPSLSLKTGRPLPEVRVREIVPGTTTKAELFERLGPPTAVMARGEVAVVAAPATWAAPLRNGSISAFDSGTVYELFGAGGAADDSNRIYYFRHVISRKMTYFMIFAVHESGDTRSDRLWALVNERTGIVEDYAFQKSGATVVFGIPRGAGAR